MENRTLIDKGLLIIRDMLAPYICRELSLKYGNEDWWEEGVIKKLSRNHAINLPSKGSYTELTDSLDPDKCMILIDKHWDEVFSKKLSRNHRFRAKDIHSYRRVWAHTGKRNEFTDDDTIHALSSMLSFCNGIDEESAAEIRALIEEQSNRNVVGLKNQEDTSTSKEKVNSNTVVQQQSSFRPTFTNKYAPLTAYLSNSELNEVVLSFDEIENVINDKLPPSAYKYERFWENDNPDSSAKFGWLNAGFMVANNGKIINTKKVVFLRA